VEWVSEEREVEVVLTESPQALVGTGMLMGKKVELDFDRMVFNVIVKE